MGSSISLQGGPGSKVVVVEVVVVDVVEVVDEVVVEVVGSCIVEDVVEVVEVVGAGWL